jgi:hypothetical protein
MPKTIKRISNRIPDALYILVPTRFNSLYFRSFKVAFDRLGMEFVSGFEDPNDHLQKEEVEEEEEHEEEEGGKEDVTGDDLATQESASEESGTE